MLFRSLLMIEVRAERAFDFYERVISSAQTFTDRPEESKHAVALVDRIRRDESVHVAWLRAAISEFRSFTIRSVDGSTCPGSDILDPVWERMVHWHGVEMHEQTRPANKQAMKQALLALENGDVVYREFEALAA